MPRPRDNQRARLYRAEDVLAGRRISRAARKHLVDTQTSTTHHTTRIDEQGLLRAAPLRYPSVEAVVAYINAVADTAWLRRRWPHARFYWRDTNGSWASTIGWIHISSTHRISEAVILHEMAHVLTPSRYAAHGPEFAGVLLTLVRLQMGAETARELRESFRTHGVKYRLGAVPQPDSSLDLDAHRRAAKAMARWDRW